MILLYFYLAILLVDFIKSIILGIKNNFTAQNYFFIYLGITLFIEIYGLYKTYLEEFNYAYIFNFYSIFVIIFFWYYYSRVLTKATKIISHIAFLGAIVYTVFFTKFLGDDFDSKLGIVSALFFIINTLLWFYQKLNSYDDEKITEDPHFWVSSGLLLWSVFFIFRVAPMYLFNDIDKEFLLVLKIVLNIINIVMYSMFYVALTKFEKRNLKI